MTIRDLAINEYFNWMYSLVCGEGHSEYISYRKLLMRLHAIEFVYTIAKDENRAADGVDLRRRFSLIEGNESYFEYLEGPCSVLEMLIALSVRCEENIMDDPTVGDRTSQWFWGMIINLGLGSMTDKYFDRDKVEFNIWRFMHRDYEPDGKGGLFRLNMPREDLRKVEIWHQMCWYLDERFYY